MTQLDEWEVLKKHKVTSVRKVEVVFECNDLMFPPSIYITTGCATATEGRC